MHALVLTETRKEGVSFFFFLSPFIESFDIYSGINYNKFVTGDRKVERNSFLLFFSFFYPSLKPLKAECGNDEGWIAPPLRNG